MNEINTLEVIGFIGSIIVAISLTMTSMKKLRWLNLIGAFIFTIYGLAIDAAPVTLVNGFITIVDIYYIVKMYSTEDYFKIIEVKRTDTYLHHFIDFHIDTILKHFPTFNKCKEDEQYCFLILRNMQVAGVFIAEAACNKHIIIDLDFAISPFQDFKTGEHLLIKNIDLFKKKGIKSIEVQPETKSLKAYYKRMGFSKTQDRNTYIKILN